MILFLVVVHEFGHYAAGVYAGVPAEAMRIRIFTYPPHVEMKDGEQWLAPWDQPKFGEVAHHYIKTRSGAILCISAGLLLQTFVFAGLIAILVAMGKRRSFLLPIAVSVLAWPVWYLCLDSTLTLLHRMPSGDYSSLYTISPLAAILLTVFVIATHVGIVLFVRRRHDTG